MNQKIESPTPEQLYNIPGWLKWKIFFILLAYTWQSDLAEIGLRLGRIF